MSFAQLTVCYSVLLQAICAKCSKTLDNKTSRVCPECFEASLSLENLGVGEQKKKAAPEVTHTMRKSVCSLVYSFLIHGSPMTSIHAHQTDCSADTVGYS